jgi:hypothetical protein
MDHLQNWMSEKTEPGEGLHNSTVAALEKIKAYYNITSDCYTVATVLDPRFNIQYYKAANSYGNSESVEKIIQAVEHIYCMYYQPAEENMQSQSIQTQSSWHKIFQKTKKTDVDSKNELERYLMEPILEGTETDDVLMWWKFNSKKYPNLSRMARDYLAIPGTSASSELPYNKVND